MKSRKITTVPGASSAILERSSFNLKPDQYWKSVSPS